LATDRGIWRRDYAPGLELRKEDFHVDAPGRALISISGQGRQALALDEDGRVLVWEDQARLFREGGFEDEDREFERVYCAPSGAQYMGSCPPGVWRAMEDDKWSALGEVEGLPEAAEWRGLEAPYEPRVSALLERPGTEGRELYCAVSVGGLLHWSAGAWASVAPTELPRDLRTLAWAHERLWLGGGQGLWWMTPEPFVCRRASLPPSAGFVFSILALPGAGMLVVAAGGPPATWRGPDGSRMSIWHFADENGVGRPIAGPIHGVITGLAFDGEAALVTTDDGELWRAPLAGPVPEGPLLADFPRVNGLFLVDAEGSEE